LVDTGAIALTACGETMFEYTDITFEGLQFSTAMTAPHPVRYAARPAEHRIPWSRPDGRYARLKRAVDMMLALVLLALGGLPMLLMALAIRLDSRGPALFRQRRVGLHGRSFEVLKFRSMHIHVPSPASCPQACRRDPRITRVGCWLRCLSLDELPQLINVLRGEMSMVGPRPHAPGTRAGGRLFEDLAPRYPERHRVRPGITGLAQVRGWRGETDTPGKLLSRIDSDLEYVGAWSLALDLWIIWCTVGAVLRMRNAY
jgi:lipopolysaccharide/colanic/teichoic acid biosynthesis glycosyltransferase